MSLTDITLNRSLKATKEVPCNNNVYLQSAAKSMTVMKQRMLPNLRSLEVSRLLLSVYRGGDWAIVHREGVKKVPLYCCL